jgi:hypothetical protein
MARIPVVGPKQLHTAQLSPQERRLLHKRAAAANRREYQPVLGADRAAVGGINRQYRNEAGSIRGANEMSESALKDALAGLASTGLSGRYLQQAKRDLLARQEATAGSLPFLLSDAQENRADALGEARQQLLQDKASMLQSTAQDFNSSLESARGDASQVLKEQQEKREAELKENEDQGKPKFDADALANAKLALQNALKKWSENPTIEVNGDEIPLQQYNPLKSKDDYLRLAHELEKEYNGFDLHDVMHVIGGLLTDRHRHEHEGRLVQPGVPGPGRG